MLRTLKEKIVVHIAYRNIFNAPVSSVECQKWLGVASDEIAAFNDSIKELIEENLIVEKDGFLCVPGQETIVDSQSRKEVLTKDLLAKGSKTLIRLSRLPFIKYIGVSGSVAANNPTLQYSKRGVEFVDLDLFVICKSNTLWLLFLVERVLTNIKKLFKGYHFYCFNYVTDETFLEVYNKNFFTATEINNLKTVYDNGIHSSFLSVNSWYNKYYNGSEDVIDGAKSSLSWTLILAPINFVFFALFCVGRALKRIELSPLLEIFGGFNPVQKCNFKRISNPNGGYQEAIKNKFRESFQTNFPQYYSEVIMEDLFPKATAFKFSPENNVYDRENAELFTKYTLNSNEKNPV
ncbi:hypothetical protein [Ekhidna sp.]